MESTNNLPANKKGKRALRGWLIALGIVAAIFLAGYICCTTLS